MYSFMIIITVALIFYLLCSILLSALNKSMLGLFVSIQKLTSKLKRKKLYSNLTSIIFITISVGLKSTYKLSDFNFALLLGFLLALQDAIFDKTIGDKKYTWNL